MNRLSDDLVQLLNKQFNYDPQECTCVIAGHYCLAEHLRDLSHDGESEELSFLAGVHVYARLRALNRPAVLLLWINDIGLDPITRQRIKESYQIPDNYATILDQFGVPAKDVDVQFESTARNKASVWFRKIYDQNPEKFQVFTSSEKTLIRCVDPVDVCALESDAKAYTIPTALGEPLVMKEGPHPKCNLILATLFAMAVRRRGIQRFVNIFNDIYCERIRLGIYVARNVYGIDAGFVNFFSDGSDLFLESFNHELDQHTECL